MGAAQSRRTLTLPLNLTDYEEVRHDRDRRYEPPFRILRNIHTGFEVQEYRLSFASEAEFRQYEDSFIWRLSQPYVVNTVYFAEDSRKQFCASSYAGTLYTEHIPLKLSEIKDIPWPDNLYILTSALEGFAQLYSKIGYFMVQQNMICINKQGKARVWVSEDLSKLTPDQEEVPYQGDERDIVRRVVELLDLNTDTTSQQQSVQGYLNRHDPMPRFGQAKRYIRQMALDHATTVPTSFDCIMDILNSEAASSGNQQRDTDRVSLSRLNRLVQRRERTRSRRDPPSTVRESEKESEYSQEAETTLIKNHHRTVRHASNIRVDSDTPVTSHGIRALQRYQSAAQISGLRNFHMVQSTPVPQTQMFRSIERSPQLRYMSPGGMSLGCPPRIVFMNHPQPQPELIPITRKPETATNRNNYKSVEPSRHKSPQKNKVEVVEGPVDHRRNRTTHYYTDSQITGGGGRLAVPHNDGYVSDTTNYKSKQPIHSDRFKKEPSPKKLKSPREDEPVGDLPAKPNFIKKIIKRKRQPEPSDEDISNLVNKMDNEELDQSNQFNYRINIVEAPFRRSGLNVVKNSYPISRNSIAMSQPAQHNTSNLLISFNKNMLQKKDMHDDTVRDKTELLERKAKLHEAISLMRDTIKGAETVVNSPRLQDKNKDKLTTEAKNYYAYKYDHNLDPEIAFDLMEKGL